MNRRFASLLLVAAAGLLLVGCLNNDEEEQATAVPPQDQVTTPEESDNGDTIGDGTAPAAPESEGETAVPPQTTPITEITTGPLPPVVFIELPPGSAIAPGSTVQHEVMEGDWLHQITRCYGAAYAAVRNANRHVHPDWIYPEDKITVPNVGSDGVIIGPPCVQRVTVQPGDTWFGLAQRYQTEARILQRANPGGLWAGRTIWAPTVPTAAPGAPPALSHDLLFNYDGDLAVWQRSDGRAAVYRDDQIYIHDIATNAAGNLVLAHQTRDQNASTEIALIDRAAGTMSVIEDGLPPAAGGDSAMPWEQLLVSPDGAWAAYVAADGAAYRLVSFATNNPGARNEVSGINHGGSEFFTPQLYPGDDGAHFLWLDGGGIYRFNYDLAGSEQVLYEWPDPDGIQGASTLAWSPAGRYLLMQVGFIEGGAYVVLDAQTGALADVPNSSGYVTVAAATWLDNGDVAVFTPPQQAGAGLTFAVYTPQTAADGTFSLLPGTTAVLVGVPQDAGPGYVINAPLVQGSTASAVFALQTGIGSGNGLYGLQTGNALPGNVLLDKLNSVPGSFGHLFWLPDSSGVLLERFAQPDTAGQIVYVDTAENPPFALSDWLGLQIGDFHWVTP